MNEAGYLLLCVSEWAIFKQDPSQGVREWIFSLLSLLWLTEENWTEELCLKNVSSWYQNGIKYLSLFCIFGVKFEVPVWGQCTNAI